MTVVCDWCRANFRPGEDFYMPPRRAELYHDDCAIRADMPNYNQHSFSTGSIRFVRSVPIEELRNESKKVHFGRR